MRKKLSFKNSQGIKLVGIVDIPKQKKDKYPTVIFFHGFGSRKSDSGQGKVKDILTNRLVKNNIAVYRFDFTGCGESEGQLKTSTISRLVKDLKEIVRFVKKQEIVDKEKMVIIGESMGGTAILASKIKGFKIYVFISPLVFIHEFRSAFKHRYNPKGLSYLWSRTRKKWNILGPEFWQDSKYYDLLNCIKFFKGKKMFIHGGSDSTVHPADSWHLYDKTLPPKEIKIYETLNHSLRNTKEKYKLVNNLVNWLKRNL